MSGEQDVFCNVDMCSVAPLAVGAQLLRQRLGDFTLSAREVVPIGSQLKL